MIDRECQTCEGMGIDYSEPDLGIDCESCDGTGERWLFNNLSSPKYPRGAMTLEQVRAELEALLTDHPSTLLADLANDQALNVGNLTIDYGCIGVRRRV